MPGARDSDERLVSDDRRNAQRVERRAYSASRRREWRSYSLRTHQPSGEDEGSGAAGREDVVRQLFDGRTGRYRGLLRVVPPADWFATLCACGVERRGEFGTLGPGAGCFLALGSGLGLVGTVSARRSKRAKNGEKRSKNGRDTA